MSTAAAAKRFAKVNVEISNICNLQCSFCPEVLRDKKMMELGLFRRVIEQAAPLAEQVCFHLMGEPLLHPDLAEMLDICAELALPVFFVSNGLLLDEEKSALLLHPILRQVSFSLHSFHDNFPGRDPQPYLDSIFRYTERAFAERPDLYVNYRLWNLKDGLDAGAHNDAVRGAVERRFGVELRSPVDVRFRKSRRIKGRLYLHYDTEFAWPSPELPVLGERGTCKGLSSHFGVLAEGTVVPCCLDKEGRIPLGDLAETPLADILGSPRARAMLDGFRRRRLVEDLCRRCGYITRFSKS